ncbi:hypothetical protein HNQ50_003945 [Silvimonas terrae]|uniref:DUF1993 domain-containing protein n=1 Tax=Silvimonas terrae TaxID=300266 RepID=A0A840RM65_9NEIS|nr:DUF1993 domain-containing protein [Silvimonas terrae]MBB5193191.1 hypothetical protein [Silvimonas terrae]
MSISLYASAVPVIKQMLGSLDHILAKTETHVAATQSDPTALTSARLFADMFPLTRQVQIACDFAKAMAGRLSNSEVPRFDDSEQTLAELRALVAKTFDYVSSIEPSRFEGGEQREIVIRPGTEHERKFNGQTYLLSYAMPQFFFHITTTYDILRHNGVPLGKKDFLAGLAAA